MGLSATPAAEADALTLIPALGKTIYRYGLSDATRDLIIAGCALYHIAVNFTDDERFEYDDFSDRIMAVTGKLMKRCPYLKKLPYRLFFRRLQHLQKGVDETAALAGSLLILLFRRKEIVHKARMRIDCGAEIVRRLMPDHRTILFTERIETTNILFETLRGSFPGQIERYHSNMSANEKARALRRYRDGESKVIVCCRALDEGLNVPETDAGIVLSVGSGARQRIQRTGRILRRDGTDRLKKIYYLYIPESAEADKLLPSENPEDDAFGYGEHTCCLSFTESGNLLSDSEYAVLAERVLAHLTRSGASDRHLRNAAAQLDRGSVRTDFLLPESACRERLALANTDEKDYLTVMLLMARVRSELISDNKKPVAPISVHSDRSEPT
jgi:superfamily II DNA or RNA helicase